MENVATAADRKQELAIAFSDERRFHEVAETYSTELSRKYRPPVFDIVESSLMG